MFFKRLGILIKTVRGKYQTGNRDYVQLAGRPYLLGSHGEGFPKSLNGPRENYPRIVHAKDEGVSDKTSAEDCALAVKLNYRELLTKYGALLLRGFPLGEVQQLNKFLCNLGENIKPMRYQSGVAVRKNLGGMVYTASDESKEISMEAHNELSYTSKWPTIVVFACSKSAGEGSGGETVLCNSQELYRTIDRDVLDSFEEKGGVQYRHHYKENDTSTGWSWKKCFETGKKQDVIDFLKSRNIEHFFDKTNSLTYWTIRPATIKHHITACKLFDNKMEPLSDLGELLWFNQASSMHGSYLSITRPDVWTKGSLEYNQMPFHTCYGNGTEIPEDYIQHLRNVSWTSAIGFQLKKNDVLFLDNEMIQHGRMSFKGERKLLAALIDDC